jgi:hypothetical protein
MPKPAEASELIALEEGAPDYRRGNWWTSFKEARLFIAHGYAEAMSKLKVHEVRALTPWAERAVRSIDQTGWRLQLPSRHWNDCAETQFGAAADEKAMLLPKIVIVIEALNLYAGSVGKDFDGFEEIKIFSAGYRPAGWSEEHHAKEKDSAGWAAFVAGARALGQRDPALLLKDLAQGQHASFGVVELVRTSFPHLEITTEAARRLPRAGVVRASDFLSPHGAPKIKVAV